MAAVPVAAQRFELNLGVILQGLILSALLWVGSTVTTLTAQMAVVQSQIADVPELRKQMAEMKVDNARLAAQVAANTARLAQGVHP